MVKSLCYASEEELKCIYNINSIIVTFTEGKTEENNDY